MSDSSPPLGRRTLEETLADFTATLSELDQLKKENSYLRSRIRYLESGRPKCKTSKWSKVKGAFGWEKDDNKDSSTLKVPERAFSDQSSSFSASPAGSCISHSSLATPPPPLSSSSSEEDIRSQGGRCSVTCPEDGRRKKNDESRRSKSLDADPSTAPFKTASSKEIKTPWSKVRGMLNTRSMRKRSNQERWPRHVLMSESVDLEEHSFDEDQCGALSTLAAPKLTVTLPSNEELAVVKRSRTRGTLDLLTKLEQNEELSPGISRKSKWFKVRNVFLQGSRSAPSSPIRMSSFTYDTEGDDMSSGDALEEKDDVFLDEDNLRFEIEASYIELQQKLEEELTKEYCREVNISPEFKKKLDEWDKMKTLGINTVPKGWEQDKERKRKEKGTRDVDKERDRVEDEKNKKPHSRVNSFRKQPNSHAARQEVLIPTSTGTFRFEGISDNFTRKLYEWEQARGIAPEESTFALLGPEYQPQYNNVQGNGVLTRSKSIGSIAEGNPGLVLVQQPSSLSLNDVNDLAHCGSVAGGVARNCTNIEPEGLMEPLFCSAFTAADISDTHGSSSSDEKQKIEGLFASRAPNSNYQLLQDNMSLLDQIKQQRDACRQLDLDMEALEGEIDAVSQSVAANHASCEQVDMYEYDLSSCYGNIQLELGTENTQQYQHARDLNEHNVGLQDFDSVHETMFDDGATQTSYEDEDVHGYTFHSRFASKLANTHERRSQLTSKIEELHDLAQELEQMIIEKEKYFFNSKNICCSDEKLSCDCCSHSQLFTAYASPAQWLRDPRSNDLYSLAAVLRRKILDFRDAFNSFSSSRGCIASPPPMSRSLHRSTAHEDLSPGDVNLGGFRTPSRASSSASSFSYLVPHTASTSRLHMDWRSAHQQQISSCDISGDLTDSVLRMSSTNVFVPTTRKIFTPVSDSEAVSLIIDEDDEALQHGNRNNDSEDPNDITLDSDTGSTNDGNDEPVTEIAGESEEPDEALSDVRTRARSSSPAAFKKPIKFSSGNIYFPTLENGELNFDENFPEAEELKLGEELTSSLKMRAFKLKKAKQEFLMLPPSRQGSLSIIVGEDVLNNPFFNGLKVKSASEEIVCAPVNQSRGSVNAQDAKGKLGTTLMSVIKSRRRTSKDVNGLGRGGTATPDGSSTKSCPPSPGFEKKNDPGTSSWMKNPAKIIFRPKGKYKISN